jgi:hypothetical protein
MISKNDNLEHHSAEQGGISSSERRNSKRFDEKLSAKLENEKCTVLNISSKGVLLQTHMPVYFFPLDKIIDFQLRLQEQWIQIKGRVMWIQSDTLNSKIGLFIQYAPEQYLTFLRQLYE